MSRALLLLALLGQIITGGSAGGGTTINATNNVLPKRSSATAFADSALTDNGTTLASTEEIVIPNGSAGTPGLGFSAQSTVGWVWLATNQIAMTDNISGFSVAFRGGATPLVGNESITAIGWTASAGNAAAALDTALSRDSAGVVDIGNGTQGDVTGTIKPGKYATGTNCAVNSASPAACGSAASGVFVVPTLTTTYTVNTTAITANSRVILQEITDNTGIPAAPTCVATAGNIEQSARVNATSFTVTLTSVTGTTCYNYWIIN